jgi:hypothetical protein
MDIKEIEFLAYTVFNKFNGVVNPVNRAVLQFNEMSMFGTSALAVSYGPNTVKVYPMVMQRLLGSDSDIKVFTIETILHELSHQDQIINYNKLTVNDDYRQFIECANIINTANFIVDHIKDIASMHILNAKELNKLRDRASVNYKSNVVKYYRKFGLFDHALVTIIHTICCGLRDERIIDDINQRYYNNEPINMEFSINNHRMPLIYNGMPITDVPSFNALVNENFSHETKYNYSIDIYKPTDLSYVFDVYVFSTHKDMCIYNSDIVFKQKTKLPQKN